MRHAWQAVVAAAAVALLAPAAAQANEVTHWNRIAMNTLVAFPSRAGAPPALQIHMGMTQGAVYDAVNATEPKHYRPYLLNRRVGANASKEAAAATAAYRVLSSIVSGVPLSIPFDNRTSLLTMLAAERDASLGPYPRARSRDRGSSPGTLRPTR